MRKTRRIFMPRIFPLVRGGLGASVHADLEETEPDQPRRCADPEVPPRRLAASRRLSSRASGWSANSNAC